MCPIVDNSSETVRQPKPDPAVPAKQFTDECEPKLTQGVQTILSHSCMTTWPPAADAQPGQSPVPLSGFSAMRISA